MITIALDEQGDFENFNGVIDAKPVFIGGVVYDDGDCVGELDLEKKRIDKYLEKVCDSVNCQYPVDLHYTEDCNRNNNSENVKLVKQTFKKTISEFLTYGTYDGEELLQFSREGKYYIFASLRGKNGKKSLLSSDVSEAVKDDFASNLYIHMAEDVVNRLIFHNPIIPDIKKVNVELATRSVPIRCTADRFNEKESEYEKLGYSSFQPNGSGSRVYKLTNADNYRTAIEREMLHSFRTDISIDNINVKSIKYDGYTRTEDMALLYLADEICAYLGFKTRGNTPAFWIDEFLKRAKEANGSAHNIIWSYADVDDYFARAWRYIEEKDYYRALSVSFDGQKFKSMETPFYNDNWFGFIKEYIEKQNDLSAFSGAVKKFKESILNNNLNQEKLLYIFTSLEALSKNIDFKNHKKESELFELYDCGISVYTHVGNTVKAKQYYEKAKRYAEYVATETYLRTRNKMAVFLCDTFEYEEALKIANENVTYHELLTNIKKEMFGSGESEFLNHAIALSQRGQVYAFMNDAKAEIDFLDALNIMDENTPDRFITESYLMHYYICKNKKKEYEKLAGEYFDGYSDLIEQFDYLVKEGAKTKEARFSLKFALYVYVKALYVFYRDSLPSKLIHKLSSIENALISIDENAGKMINGHPWEMIYKYLALIMKDVGDSNRAEAYCKKCKEMFTDSEGLIRQITEESIRRMENGDSESLTYMYY